MPYAALFVLLAVSKTAAASKAGTAQPCEDATDSEVKLLSNGFLTGCATAELVCEAMPAVATACPRTCGTCGRRELSTGVGGAGAALRGPLRRARRGQDDGANGARHSMVHRKYLGRRFRLSWAFGDTMFWRHSAPEGRFVGFVPDLLGAVSEELGMDFVMEYAPVVEIEGQRYVHSMALVHTSHTLRARADARMLDCL